MPGQIRRRSGKISGGTDSGTGRARRSVARRGEWALVNGKADISELGSPRKGNFSFFLGFQPFGMEGAFPIDPLVGMGTEEVTLGLEQVGGEACGAVAVVVGE